jgi:hypothetical protein
MYAKQGQVRGCGKDRCTYATIDYRLWAYLMQATYFRFDSAKANYFEFDDIKSDLLEIR